MPTKVNELDRMLRGKLSAVVKEGARHTKYYIYSGEILLATTVLSRSYEEVDDSLFARIAREMYVNSGQLRLLINCPWSSERYVAHVRSLMDLL